jgi:hypothetical protein
MGMSHPEGVSQMRLGRWISDKASEICVYRIE